MLKFTLTKNIKYSTNIVHC